VEDYCVDQSLVFCVVVCPFVLFLLAIVLSVLHRFTDSDYLFGIFRPFYCLSDFNLRLLIAPLVYFDHCIVCLTSIYVIRLLIAPLVSSNFWPLYCLSYFNLRFLIAPLVFSNFWPLYCLSFFDLQFLIAPLVFLNF